jgi:hypothetical protein
VIEQTMVVVDETGEKIREDSGKETDDSAIDYFML